MGALPPSRLNFCRNGFFLVSISFDMSFAVSLAEQIFHPTDIVVIYIFVNVHTHASLWLHVIKSQIEINSYVCMFALWTDFYFPFQLWIRPKKNEVMCVVSS